MKCTNKTCKYISICLLFVLFLNGCGQLKIDFAYNPATEISGFDIMPVSDAQRVPAFAADLCIVSDENIMSETVDMSKATSAALFDLNNLETLYAKNVHEKLQPASLTKIMTALVALKYGSMDQVLTASSSININEKGAQLCGLKVGDQMTLDQALHALLMYSANDAAMLIAEGVGGSVENFVAMMNEEAKALGATNTNFMNPHGLTQDNHYTTVYDLYLIFNEAIQYDTFKEIIYMKTYSTVYKDKDGKDKELSVSNTNRYFQGDYKAPDNITVLGGKTGTTNAAGHCLIMLSKDTQGAPYISIILGSSARETVYEEMTDLLDEIGK